MPIDPKSDPNHSHLYHNEPIPTTTIGTTIKPTHPPTKNQPRIKSNHHWPQYPQQKIKVKPIKPLKLTPPSPKHYFTIDPPITTTAQSPPPPQSYPAKPTTNPTITVTHYLHGSTTNADVHCSMPIPPPVG